MAKLFGFMLAFAATISSANAALLVSYDFNDVDQKEPSVVTNGIVAEEASGNWSYNSTGTNLSQSLSSTGTKRTETFEWSVVSPNTVSLSTFTFDTSITSGTRTIGFTPTFKLDSSIVSASLYTVSQATGGGAYTVTFTTPLVIGGDQSFSAAIAAQASGSGTGTTSFTLDNVNFNGTLVPEPASMAVFGLLGAGVAIRRLRRKA